MARKTDETEEQELSKRLFDKLAEIASNALDELQADRNSNLPRQQFDWCLDRLTDLDPSFAPNYIKKKVLKAGAFRQITDDVGTIMRAKEATGQVAAGESDA